MSTGVKYLDKCDLSQACEWIAFGYKPRLAIYEAASTPPRPSPYEPNQLKIEKYLKDMNDAKNKLKLALFQKTIIAKGWANKNDGLSRFLLDDDSKPYHHAIHEKNADSMKNFLSVRGFDESRELMDILDVPDKFIFDVHMNVIQTNSREYWHVQINFSDLQNIFPRRASDIIKQPIKESGAVAFGRKTTLTPSEITQLALHAQKISSEYKSQKQFMHTCIEWVKNTFGKDISLTTIQNNLRPVIDEWKLQKNGK